MPAGSRSEHAPIGPADVRRAAAVLRGVAHRTPLLTSRTLDRVVGARVFVKAECLQRGGSFKFRGAYNRISSLSREERRRGVVAFSSGNHAQAVALAASLLGAPATIVMPEDAPALKLDATRGYGADVVTYDRHREDREALGAQLAADRGLTLVRPFDDPLVMAGQGTAALELLEEAGEIDALLAPVSGGGLDADHARVEIPVPRTIADALMLTTPGELAFELGRRLLDGIVTVTDEELIEAMRFLFERMKLVAEPGGAAAVAALVAGRLETEPEDRIGVILSGGNIGAARFAELVGARGER